MAYILKKTGRRANSSKFQIQQKTVVNFAGDVEWVP